MAEVPMPYIIGLICGIIAQVNASELTIGDYVIWSCDFEEFAGWKSTPPIDLLSHYSLTRFDLRDPSTETKTMVSLLRKLSLPQLARRGDTVKPSPLIELPENKQLEHWLPSRQLLDPKFDSYSIISVSGDGKYLASGAIQYESLMCMGHARYNVWDIKAGQLLSDFTLCWASFADFSGFVNSQENLGYIIRRSLNFLAKRKEQDVFAISRHGHLRRVPKVSADCITATVVGDHVARAWLIDDGKRIGIEVRDPDFKTVIWSHELPCPSPNPLLRIKIPKLQFSEDGRMVSLFVDATAEKRQFKKGTLYCFDVANGQPLGNRILPDKIAYGATAIVAKDSSFDPNAFFGLESPPTGSAPSTENR